MTVSVSRFRKFRRVAFRLSAIAFLTAVYFSPEFVSDSHAVCQAVNQGPVEVIDSTNGASTSGGIDSVTGEPCDPGNGAPEMPVLLMPLFLAAGGLVAVKMRKRTLARA